MKIGCMKFILALLVIVLISSCATQKVATPETPAGGAAVETPPAKPPVEETPKEVPKPTEVVEPEEKPATAEIEVMYAGFDPKELTVKKGTTVTFTAIQGKHLLIVEGKTLNNGKVLEEGASTDYTFNKVGKIKVMDKFNIRFPMYVTVEEETK